MKNPCNQPGHEPLQRVGGVSTTYSRNATRGALYPYEEEFFGHEFFWSVVCMSAYANILVNAKRRVQTWLFSVEAWHPTYLRVETGPYGSVEAEAEPKGEGGSRSKTTSEPFSEKVASSCHTVNANGIGQPQIDFLGNWETESNEWQMRTQGWEHMLHVTVIQLI